MHAYSNKNHLRLLFATSLIFSSVNALSAVAQNDDFSGQDIDSNDFETDVNSDGSGRMQNTPVGSQPGGYPARGGCDDLSANFAAPRIQISSHDKYRVSGTVEGICLLEAGYYDERGNNQRIQVTKVPRFSSYRFTITPGKDGGEIRVRNSKGDDATYTVEAKPTGAKNDPFGTGVNGMPDELGSTDDDMSTEITNDN